MGKKKTRSKYTSNGGVANVSKKVSNAVRRDTTYGDRLANQLKSWAKGRRTMVTIENPNKNETNKRFIRVEGNDPKAFGPWKRSDRQDNRDRSEGVIA